MTCDSTRPGWLALGFALLSSVLVRLMPLSTLTLGGCIWTSSLIDTANEQTPTWDQHQRIASAWRTPGDDLLLLCEGQLAGGHTQSYTVMGCDNHVPYIPPAPASQPQ